MEDDMDDHATKLKIQELTEKYTAKELAAAYLKASRRAADAEAKATKVTRQLIDLQLRDLTRRMGGL